MSNDNDNIYFLDPRAVIIRQRNKRQYRKKVLSQRSSFPRIVECRLNLDESFLRGCGQYADMSYLGKYFFKGTSYSMTRLAQAVNRDIKVVSHWKTRGALPEPIFKAFIPRVNYCWVNTYVFEEVQIMVKHLDFLFKTCTNVRHDQPEITLMNQELELFRDEMRRSLTDGSTVCWS